MSIVLGLKVKSGVDGYSFNFNFKSKTLVNDYDFNF